MHCMLNLYENNIHNVYFLNEIIAKLYVLYWWNVAITLQIHNFIMVLYFKSKYKLSIRLRSSTVERLTSRSEGCVFESRRGQWQFSYFIILKFISQRYDIQKLVPFSVIGAEVSAIFNHNDIDKGIIKLFTNISILFFLSNKPVEVICTVCWTFMRTIYIMFISWMKL